MSDYPRPPNSDRGVSSATGGEQKPKPWRPRLGRFLLLWVFLPGLYASGLLLWGVHLGARRPDTWYTGIARWLAQNQGP